MTTLRIDGDNEAPVDNRSENRSSEDNGGNAQLASSDKAKASQKPSKFISALRRDINTLHSDIPILTCCAISGLCDSVAFNATGTFASMQTGNTIFLALGAASLPANSPHLWLRAIVSIGAFWAGCLVFSKLIFAFKPKTKLTLASSFALQAVCVVITAALAQSQVTPSFGLSNLPATLNEAQRASRDALEDNAKSLIPLALLAFQFGGQIVASRVLGFNEVPTTVLTSLYCDMLSDPLLMAGPTKNPKRNRRLAAMVLFLTGGITGAWIQRSSAGMAAVLWIAAGIKAVLALTWLFWRSEIVLTGGMV